MTNTRTIAIVAALLGLTAASAVQAQEGLLSRAAPWLRCSIVAGRVAVDGTRLSNMRSTTKGVQRAESLDIHNENGQFTLNYRRTTGEEELVVELTGLGERVLMRRTPQGSSSVLPVEFRQAPNEKIVLTLGSGTGQQTYRAQGIWQLLIAQPKPCREHLLPLLELLRPNWKLAETADAVEEKLLSEAGGVGASGRTGWAALVTQLASESFAKREAADRALRSGDGGALAYLRQLDFSRLDAEQQFRVRRIIEVLAAQNSDDSGEQVAASLAADPAVWLALLGRPQPATRQKAARELAALLGDPITVDPAADPDTQKDRREQLRARIEGK
jgi:hypothetical protein